MTQKTWFVTGASRGIGAEIAKAVLAAGDQLIATSRKKSDLDQFESNPNVLTLSLDVSGYRSTVQRGLMNLALSD